MEIEYKKANLSTIGKGAAVELFDEEFKKVLANINDISIDATAVREITLKFKIKPTKDRLNATTLIESTCKLPGIMPHESQLFLGHEGNTPVAHVSNMNQPELEFKPAEGQEQNG